MSTPIDEEGRKEGRKSPRGEGASSNVLMCEGEFRSEPKVNDGQQRLGRGSTVFPLWHPLVCRTFPTRTSSRGDNIAGHDFIAFYLPH